MNRFNPWIGEQYGTGGILGVRTLLLGESHYGPPAWDYPEFTRDVIQGWGIEKRDRFLTTVAKTVWPKGGSGWLSDEDRQAFYQSVAFYNYIQRLVGETARQRPTPAMWAEARVPFLNAIAQLRPQAIIVLGTELWAQLPPGDSTHSDATVLDSFRVYSLSDGTCALAANVPHPSSWGYRFSVWQPKVQALLSQAAVIRAPRPQV